MQYIPEVEFSELEKLSKEDIDKIKRIGSVVIHNIVPDEDARKRKTDLDEFVKTNPDVGGRRVRRVRLMSVLTSGL